MWENNGEQGIPCSETNTDISKTFQDRADGLNLSEKSGFQVRRDKFHTFFVGKWSPCVPSERPKFWDFQASSEERRIYPWEKTPSAIQTADLLLLIDTVYIYYIVGYQPMVTLLIFKQLVIFQLPSRIDEISNRKCRLWELELMKICPPRRLQTELSRSPLKNAWVT